MHLRRLGDTTVSAIGIGDLDLAIADARGLTLTDVERALHAALDIGVTLIDVTDDERAERLAADAVRTLRMRDRAVIATRVRPVADQPGPPRDVLVERLPPRYVQERVEATLRATKLDALPLAMLPIRTAWLASRAWPELAGTCDRLTREGKVLRWGARLDLAAAEREARLADELAEAAALRDPFVVLSVVYSACDRRAQPLVDGTLAGAPVPAPRVETRTPGGLILSLSAAIDPIATNDVAGPRVAPIPIFAREPLAGGTLAGAIGPGVKRTLRDDRNSIDDAMLERIAVAMAHLAPFVRHEPPAARSCDAARAIFDTAPKAERDASTVAELALRYVLEYAIALPRLHRHTHIADSFAAAMAAPLPTEMRARIERALS